MKYILANIFMLFSLIGFGQGTPKPKPYVLKTYQDANFGVVHESIDPISGDTTRSFSKSGRYIKKSKQGVLLVEGYNWGGMGTRCGCETRKHGYWIERYRNGKMKDQGHYDCDRKTGTWVYYYENGQISKVETLKEAYLEMLTRNENDWDTLKRYFLHEGPYLEYYQNGQLKTEGAYVIMEEFSATDTLIIFDANTYEEKIEVRHGKFWMPRSKKIGIWNEYDEKGRITSQQIYRIEPREDEKIRPLEVRYWEVFSKIFLD